MKDKIQNLIKELETNVPATDGKIKQLEDNFNVNLPDDYKQFLLLSDGVTGNIGNNYVDLWSVDNVINLNKEHNVSEFFPGFVLFGTDGGNEAYAFDFRNEDLQIIQTSLIPLDENSSNVISDNFIGLLEKLTEN